MTSVNGLTRALAFALIAASMVLGGLFVSPSANAQDDDAVTYAADTLLENVQAGTTCSPIGTIDDADATVNGDYCRPDGFGPVVTSAECDAGASFFGVQYGFSASLSTCIFRIYNPGSTMCQPPGIAVSDLELTNGAGPFDFVGCGFALLSDAVVVVEPPPPPPMPTGGLNSISVIAETAATSACIESPEVQDDPASQNMGIGETFVGQNGNRFSITTGGPTCTFNGAGCDASLNIGRVADVGTCLAAIAAEAAVAEEPAEAGAAPATASAAPSAVAAATDGELALTGEEHERGAALAGALFGTGLSVLAGARLFRRRQSH